jgi:hypothetical protein
MATTATQSPFPSDVIAMARRVAALADFYWAPDCFPKEFDAAKQSWLSAVTQFVSSYSFERAGAPPIYRAYARRALEKTGWGLAKPTTAFAREAWEEFELLARAKGHGTNPKVNALCPGKGAKVTAVEFVVGLSSDGHNLFVWATNMLSARKAEDAVGALRRIRGVERKIATFYLRDVARAAALEEAMSGPGWCFQPIDVWVRRAALAWDDLSGRRVTDDRKAAELIVELAKAAGVGGGDLNGGVWILGSQLVDRNADPDLRRTLASSANLEACLDANLRWSRAIIAGIERSTAAVTPSM